MVAPAILGPDAGPGLIYRIATDDAALGPAGWTPERTRAYRPVIDLAIKYTDSTPN